MASGRSRRYVATPSSYLTSRWLCKSFGKLSRASYSHALIGPRIRPLSPRLRRAAAVHEVQLGDHPRDATESRRGPLTASWHDTRHRTRHAAATDRPDRPDQPNRPSTRPDDPTRRPTRPTTPPPTRRPDPPDDPTDPTLAHELTSHPTRPNTRSATRSAPAPDNQPNRSTITHTNESTPPSHQPVHEHTFAHTDRTHVRTDRPIGTRTHVRIPTPNDPDRTHVRTNTCSHAPAQASAHTNTCSHQRPTPKCYSFVTRLDIEGVM